jgi:hypothetical protein
MTVPLTTNQMPRPTGRQVAGGLGALCVLAVGLVGIPVILAAIVGWPLPHHIPTGGQAASAFGNLIPDSFWPRLFATLAWLAWAYFVFSVIAGVAAQLRGRRPGRYSRLYASSAMAALIAAILILGQLRGAHTARTGPTAQPVPVVRLVAQTAAEVVPSVLVSTDPTAQPATFTHTVVPGDTLWSIAVQYYGDGTQWQVIYQANIGLSQPGGGALTDAHWIFPGWTLTIPAATQSAPPPAAIPATASIPTVSPAAVSPTVAPTTTQPDHHTVGQPSSIGHALVPQATKTHAVSSPKAETPSTPENRSHHEVRAGDAPTPRAPLALHRAAESSSAHTDRSRTSNKTDASASGPHGSEIGPIAVGAGIFGLAAIGLVTALDRRRRRQIGRRSFGRHIPRPEPKSPLADLELQLRHYARAGQVFWLTHLAEMLAYAAQVAGVAPPDVLGVQVSDLGLDVLVTAESADPLSPFERLPDHPAAWHLPFTIDPAILDEAVVAPTVPLALATVGQGVDGTVLVNLDHYESVHITIDAGRVEGTLAAIATELAGTTAPTGTTVIAVGLGYGVVDRLEGGVVVDNLDEAMALVRPAEMTVILIDPEGIAEQLFDLVRGAANLHLVTAGPITPDGTALVIDPVAPSFDVHHLDAVQPSQVSDDLLEEVQTLFELAEDDSDSEMSEPNLPSDKVSVGKITLALLGEPSISVDEGDPQDLVEAVSPTAGTKARRVIELLVYLAAHDGSATRGEWLTDISPDKVLSDGYVRNLVLLTRRSLEAISGDPDLLAYDKATQRFTLAERVGTDWRQFQSVASDEDPEGLRSALALVCGVPFGANPDPWTSAGGLSYVIADDITDAARTLGELALVDGDLPLATWAARQGQLANRYDQGLWRILLQSAVETEGLQRIWSELNALAAIDGDSAADLDATTADLYNDLISARVAPAEVVVFQDDDEIVIPTRQAV